jgi:hypothetical protein
LLVRCGIAVFLACAGAAFTSRGKYLSLEEARDKDKLDQPEGVLEE